MLTFLGVIIMLAAFGLLILKSHLREKDEIIGERMGQQVVKQAHPAALVAFAKKGWLLVFFGLILAMQSQVWFYARQGHQYHVLTPTGQKYMVASTGIKFIMPFSKIQEWQKYIDVKTVAEGESTDGIEGVIRGGIPVRFIDQVTGTVSLSGRFQIPSSEENFLALVEEFRDQPNLVNNTLIPTVREQVINTGYMYAAQDYVSGSAADFRTTLDEQLKDGGYSVEKKEIFETTFLSVNIKQDGDRQIKDIRTTYEVIKREDINGKPIRVAHDINKNNIDVSQVIVDAVALEQKFKERLEAQRDISAQKRIEIEKIETAKAAQQRIVAEGERDKAAERVTKEKEQVAALIAIETMKKQEVTKKELAKIALETEKLNSQALKVKKDAEAYANKKLVQAGLTPQEQAQIYKDTQIGVAQALAGPNGITLPQMYMSGQGNGKSQNSSNDMLMQIMTMMMAQQSMDKVGKPSGK